MEFLDHIGGTIVNHTEYKTEYMADVIKYLGIKKNVSITLTKFMRTIQDSFIKATVTPNPFGYTIYVNNELTQQEARSAIIHEMCHIIQYEDGRLKGGLLITDQIMWNGKKLVLEDIRRDKFPHEKDAISKTTEVLLYLKKIRKERRKKIKNSKEYI